MKDFQSLVEETKVLVQKEIENKDNRPCLAVTKGINSFFVHNINLKFLIVISLFCSQI